MSTYFSPEGGLPPQTQLLTDRAVVKEAYTVIPKGVLPDIVTSNLPGWTNTRAWIIARPIAGFATTFSQLIVEMAPGGGSDKPEFGGRRRRRRLRHQGRTDTDPRRRDPPAGGRRLRLPGGRAGLEGLANDSAGETASFQWIRKAYERLEGFTAKSFVTREPGRRTRRDAGTDGAWKTTRFADPDDLAHDMQVNIVTFQPGAVHPVRRNPRDGTRAFRPRGQGRVPLNDDWVEVEAGDFMWLRAFCPQACYAGGPGPFRYLLYKDINRQIRLT